MKRITSIKIPQRPSKPSGRTSHQKEICANEDLARILFSRSLSSLSVGGKASDQAKRSAVSQEDEELTCWVDVSDLPPPCQ